MLEPLAVWLGRHVTLRGTGRLLSTLYPCNHATRRYVRGVRARGDGLLMDLDSRNWIDWNLLFRGGYEPHVTRLLDKLVPRGGVVVDAGANIGAHTLSMANAVGPAGRVLACEPNPAVRAVLERNLALNGLENTILFDCALGDQRGVLPLRVPRPGTAEYSNMGMASLVALETPHDLIDVQVRRLDEVFDSLALGRLDLVKIDVQGYEGHVLAGMGDLLQRYGPAVIFEYEAEVWDEALTDIAQVGATLVQAGYRLWRLTAHGGIDMQSAADFRGLPDHAELLALQADDLRRRALGD